MALQFRNPAQTPDNQTLQLFLSENETLEPTAIRETFFPAEWFPQSGVQLTWPHAATDWSDMLAEVTECYLRMTYEIACRELLLIVTPQPEPVKALLKEKMPVSVMQNIRFATCPTNDTWARDYGFITLMSNKGPLLLDFCFNGWGMKFEAHLDNQINGVLMQNQILQGEYVDCLDFVFEGGSIESDGEGTLLTTSTCLLSAHRNEGFNRQEVETYLLHKLHAHRLLWLDHGYLAGDDTDSHIDTLARLCPNHTIAYVQCQDTADEHYEELQKMEKQLQGFTTATGDPYRLLPLPLPHAIFDEDGERLPATYANFLVVNGAILLPTYAQPQNDEQARLMLQKAFPKYEIIGIDCRPLIRQHGSLHCCTMQFPVSVFKT